MRRIFSIQPWDVADPFDLISGDPLSVSLKERDLSMISRILPASIFAISSAYIVMRCFSCTPNLSCWRPFQFDLRRSSVGFSERSGLIHDLYNTACINFRDLQRLPSNEMFFIALQTCVVADPSRLTSGDPLGFSERTWLIHELWVPACTNFRNLKRPPIDERCISCTSSFGRCRPFLVDLGRSFVGFSERTWLIHDL